MISVFLSQHLPLDLTQNHSGALLRTNRSLRVRRRTQIAAMGSPGSLLSRATAPEVNNAVGKHVQKYARSSGIHSWSLRYSFLGVEFLVFLDAQTRKLPFELDQAQPLLPYIL